MKILEKSTGATQKSNFFTLFMVRCFCSISLIMLAIVVVPLMVYKAPKPADISFQEMRQSEDSRSDIAPALSPPMTPRFIDDTLNLGIFHEHRQAAAKVSDIIDVLGGGVCIGDVDGDYIDDLIFTTGSGSTRNYGKPSWWQRHDSITLYLNKIDHFLERTTTFGLDLTEATMGCLLADFDNDGFNDLLITSVNGSRLYRNRHGARFTPVDSFAEHSRRWNTCSTVTDINDDGLADIYLCHYLRYKKNQRTLEVASGFDTGRDSRFDPRLYDGIANQLLINQGELVFKDMTGEYFAGNNQDRTLSSLWGDFNGDQHTDLLVLNDTGSPSRLYLGNHRGRLVETDNLSLPFRLLAAHFAVRTPDDSLIITRPMGLGISYLPTLTSTIAGRQLDSSWNSGINHRQTLHLGYWGANAADFNLDGDYDLFLATGLRRPDSYSPTQTLGQANQLLVKDRDLFHRLTTDNRNRWLSSRSSGVTDLNIDGKPDIIVANNNGAPQILLNQTATQSHWLALKSQSPLPVTLRLRQGGWQRTLTLGNRPLFLGSEQGFHTVAVPLEQPIEVDLGNRHNNFNDDQTKTLSPNSHYVIDNGDFLMVSRNSATLATIAATDIAATDAADAHDKDLFDAKASIHSAPLFVKRAWLQQHLTRRQRLTPGTVAYIKRLTDNSNDRERDVYRQLIVQLPTRMELLPLYLSWARAADSTTITDTIAKAALEHIRRLESDLATTELLTLLYTADDARFCQITDVFSTWYEQEEAVTRTKYLAVPVLIKRLASANPRQVICAANALAHSEHLTATTALIDSYPQLKNADSRYAVIHALGMIRQRQADGLLQDIMHDYRRRRHSTDADSQQAKIPVAAAIARNRLAAGQGGRQLIELLSDQLLAPESKAAIIAELLWPQHRIHFTDATLATVRGILQDLSQSDYSPRHAFKHPLKLTPIHQLLLSVWQPELATTAAVIAGIGSTRAHLRQRATALLPELLTELLTERLASGLSPDHAKLPATILGLPQWPQLTTSAKKQVLQAISVDWLTNLTVKPTALEPIWGNAIMSIGLMPTPLAKIVMQWLAGHADIAADMSSRYCATPYPDLYWHHYKSTRQQTAVTLSELSLSGIAAALYTPIATAKHTTAELTAWLNRQIQSSAKFLPCLSRLQMTSAQAEKISLGILALADNLETAKQRWLLSTQVVNRFVYNGINSRLRRGDIAFTHRYLEHIKIDQITEKQLELLTQYPRHSHVHLFATLVQLSRRNSTEQISLP